jgi:hypothetical protein
MNHISPYALYSEEADDSVKFVLEQARHEGWYWPQVYYYIVDTLQDEFSEVNDSSARSAIYNAFVHDFKGKGVYDDYFNYIKYWYSKLYRDYMTVPPKQIKPIMKSIPKKAKNAITMSYIKEGENMVNFHDEFDRGRFYTERTHNSTKDKKNPYTQHTIFPTNVSYYRAHLQGGKRRTRTYRKASKKSTRKANRK